MTTEIALKMLLKLLHLPAFTDNYEDVARKAEKEAITYEHYLHELAQLEVYERHNRKIMQLIKRSCLPGEKTLETLEQERLPRKIRALLPTLCEGGFLSRSENILAFGNPGTGKTHLLCAIAHELVKRGHAVLFTSC
jgi:DNA replication protein DnaC